MKMVKSLLLGSAAGLLAVAGAQAADMPVKAAAKPVEYVKICSLYGAGFYYLPGTDICVKIGGYVRGQYYYNTSGAASGMNFQAGVAGNQYTRFFNDTNDFVMRARTIITMDTRAQTEWGTVRTYMNIGWTQDSNGSGVSRIGQAASLYVNRAFIQWAGFTFGKAQSFWDVIPIAAFTYYGHYTSDTGDGGTNLAAYTAQWGNGISTTLAIEDPRRWGVWNTQLSLANSNVTVGGTLNNDYVQVRYPDIVSNFRIDQAWGSFQVMTALHDASAAYWFSSCGAPGTTITGAFNCGYPGDKWGWAAGVGAVINLPFIAPGDRFSFQVNVAEGATAYVFNPASANAPGIFQGAYSLGMGHITDAVLRDPISGVQNGSLELTKSWGAIAAFEHLWTPRLRTSWYGGAFQVDYNGNATTYICDEVALAPAASSTSGGFIGNVNRATCNPDFGVWFVGSRTQWNIRPDFYMGVDVLYQKLETSFEGLASWNAVTGQPRPSGSTVTTPYRVEDQEALSFTFRVHRDILP